MAHRNTTRHSGRQVNLHTHSHYCGHGAGELFEFADSAERVGLTALGFSEHCPVPDNRWGASRMRYKQQDSYMHDCRTVQAQRDDLSILCGFECDHDARYLTYYREQLLDSGYADYLIFGLHYLDEPDHGDTYIEHLPPTATWLHSYTDRYIDGLCSGLYLFGVHPDLFGMFYTRWDAEAISCSRSILACAESERIPLEINGYGFRKPLMHCDEGMRIPYPLYQFWDLAAAYDIRVIVNSDTHYPEHMDLSGTGAHELADNRGLKHASWSITENGSKSMKAHVVY